MIVYLFSVEVTEFACLFLSIGGPIVLTLPHMLGTDDVYRTVIGQNPDLEKHLIFADIEPVCELKKENPFGSLLMTYEYSYSLFTICRIPDTQ